MREKGKSYTQCDELSLTQTRTTVKETHKRKQCACKSLCGCSSRLHFFFAQRSSFLKWCQIDRKYVSPANLPGAIVQKRNKKKRTRICDCTFLSLKKTHSKCRRSSCDASAALLTWGLTALRHGQQNLAGALRQQSRHTSRVQTASHLWAFHHKRRQRR